MRLSPAVVAAAVLALAPGDTPAHAQNPVPAQHIGSLGQPAASQWTGAAAMAWDARAQRPDLSASFGVRRDLLNPLLSLLAAHAEGYVQLSGDVAPGVRARFVSPFARIGAGIDYRIGDDGPDLLLSFFHPIRRGGLFADASVLRLDYLPRRERSVWIGIEKPVLRTARLGRSRPERDFVRLPAAPARRAAARVDPVQLTALATLADAARRVRVTTLPLGPIPADGGLAAEAIAAELQPVQQALPDIGTSQDVVGAYHNALERVFSIAVDNGVVQTSHAREIAATARRVLLSEVLLPYDRLLGQRKRSDTLRGYAARAYTEFERWLHVQSIVSPPQRDAALDVFSAWLDIIEANRAAALAQWRDNRFVWLPLQYALRPEEHDTQTELDAIVEQAVGERFTDGNFVSWVVNEQFQYHLSRTIREASDYHVLLTHDFRGIDGGGAPDEMSYRHVVGSYLAALTQHVRAYDRTGRIPTYMIVLDQWFYEVNRGRLWLTLLEDPLEYRLELPPAQRAWQDSIASAQQALRAAVQASALLQSQVRRNGTAWLRNLVSVHVSITNPADPSFWSTSVIRGLPLPDNMMRDHRKIVFYDITEDDPYRGEAIFTGAGVGEHYASLSWEDRSLLVRGPALLRLKSAARELLVNQGLPSAQLPHALLPRPLAADYDARVRTAMQRNLQPLRALQGHNGAGFSDKQVNVAKAVLYTLMPPGSVIKIPDSLWSSDFWGSALLGCALRGGRVLIIAPAEGNAPADVIGALGRSHELLGRLITADRLLRREIDSAGGLLRVGLYSSTLAVSDIPAKVRSVQVAFGTVPWLRSLFAFPQSVLDDLGDKISSIRGLAMAPGSPAEFEHDDRPKLHLKANFFASREAWTLLNRPEWANASWAYMTARIAQLQDRPAAVGSFSDVPDAIADVGGGMVRDWHAALDPTARDRVIFYTMLGSHNQNTRSMVIDAEVAFLISQWPAIIPYIDLITIIGQTRWIDDAAQLTPLLPRDEGWTRRLVQWIRLTL